MGTINYHSGVDWSLVLDADQLLVSQLIERRNIRWLCHFTPRSNLENIKQNGLKTRNLLSYNEAIVTDNYRYDQYKNAICLSISKPNQWMLKRKLEQGYDLCLLLIDPAVLYKKECIFYPHNAATASFSNASPESFKGEEALEALFANPITFQKSGQEPTIRNRISSLRDYETTSDQAEVQCLENIELEYILHIFEDEIPLTYDDIENKAQIGSTIDKYLNTYIEDKGIRGLKSNSVAREKRLEQVAKKMAKTKLTNEDIKLIKEHHKHIQNMFEDVFISSSREEKQPITTKKVTEPKQERKKIDYSSSSSVSSSGDGCLGFIILVILLIIFVF
ncbi:DUF4433 domain-containing protein [Aggregatibacter actinomycetemcomitans]|nr:DUF4433 domain-containing protein [Aggregatibacter actinomycetemcomitans]